MILLPSSTGDPSDPGFHGFLMTVAELRKALEGLPDEMRVGVVDADEKEAEIQFLGATSHYVTGEMYFLIVPNAGYPLFGEQSE